MSNIQTAALIIASGASTSSYADFGGRSLKYMAVYHTAGGAVDILGSDDGATFTRLFERVNTAPVQYQTMIIGSAQSGVWVQNIAPPVRYIQFAATGTVANGTTIKVSVSD